MNLSPRGDSTITPRRSVRIQRKKSPEMTTLSGNQPRGPRAMAKLNKSKPSQSIPAIVINSPKPDVEKKKDPAQTPEKKVKKAKTSNKAKASESTTESNEIKKEEPDVSHASAIINSDPVDKEIEKQETSAKAVGPVEETETAAEKKEPEDTTENEQQIVSENKNNAVTTVQIKVEEVLNTSPQLMDESIISIAESIDNTVPPKDATFSPKPQETKKDSTFSPIVDRSLHDSRPHIIDIQTDFNITPIHRNITHRTSTPLANKIMKRETPKAGMAVMSALGKVFSPKLPAKVIEALNDTVNGQFKFINPLEKSILKSTRKRSLSVTDTDSLVQKKVMFISPKVMDIGEIDERMMQSFREEKENSILRAQVASGTRRKRSLSASEMPHLKAKKQMPDFKAIHEAQFKKMESILEHKERKVARAKKLITPSKSLPTDGAKTVEQSRTPQASTSSQPIAKVAVASKIPKSSRVPLVTRPPGINAQVSRPLARSQSAEPQTTQIKKPSFVPTLSRAISQETVKPKINFPPVKAKSQMLHGKAEERREKYRSLYKTNVTQTGTADIRKKNESFIKGVRLNRRFDLMMRNRLDQASLERADD